MNATASIIAILDHLKVDTKVLDIGMETTESNDFREVSENNGDANDMLAAM